jgi:hypothetical protein
MTKVGSDQVGTKEIIVVKNRGRFWAVRSLFFAVTRNVPLLNHLSYTRVLLRSHCRRLEPSQNHIRRVKINHNCSI